TIEAKIKERGEAKKTYEAAKNAGQTASLLEQDRPNVFRMNVANLLPGDEIKVEVSYVELIVPSEHVYEVVVPNSVGPRYGHHANEGDEHDQFVKSGYLNAGVPAAHTFALDALVEAPLAIRRMASPSHATVQVAFPSATAARVHLAESDTTS